MTIKEVQYVIDELVRMKAQGGAKEVIARYLLSLEATEFNLRKCLNDIGEEWKKEIIEHKK